MNGLAVFATGAGSLAIEVLLVRALAPVLGAAPRTLGAVVAAFLLALALGSLAARGRAGRARRPERVFAVLSIAAGVAGALTILVAPRVAAAVALPRASLALDPYAFAAAFVLALPAAFLMGAAFPFVVAAEGRGRESVSSSASRVYGLNTLGGVAGAILTPVLLLPALGVALSAAAAGGLEVLGGLLAAAGAGGRSARAERAVAVEPAGPAPRPTLRVLAAMALVSALALAAEMALARLLALFLRNSVFTVAVLLAGFLLGNGFGSLAFAGAAARSRDPRRLLGLLLAGAGLAAAAGLHAVFLLARAAESGARVGGPGYLGLTGVAAEMAFELSLASPIVVLPAFFFGAAFPCLLRLTLAPGAPPGPPVASLVAASGLGSVAGSALGAAALVPLLGASRAALAVGALAAVAGGALLSRSGARGLAAAALLLFAAAAIPVGERLRVRGASAAAGAEIVSYVEGPAAAVAVVRERSGALRLEVNGTYSQGGGDGLVLERRQGFLSSLLASEPVRRVLVIGVGTGHTLSALLATPGVEEVEAVEILPEVAAALPLFSATNGGVANDPRVRLVLDDGRRVARERAGAGLDLVLGDLFFPWEAGAGALYSREQFEAVRAALREGGTFVQWLPLHQLGPDVLASVVATFLVVFPDAALVLGAAGASSPIAALVARRDTGAGFSLGRLEAAFAIPSLAADLARHGLVDPFDALALFVAEGGDLAHHCAGAPVNTDDRPFVELRAPAHAATDAAGLGLVNVEALLAIRSVSPAPLAGARGEPPPGLVRRHAAYARLATGFLEEIRAARDPRARVVPDYAEMYLWKEEAEHLAAFEIDPRGGFVRVVATERALARLRASSWGEALSLLERMAEIEPDEPAWRSLAAVALLGLGDAAEGAASVRRALERRPEHAPDHALLGRALAASGDAAAARAAFEEALRLDPGNAAARDGLAALDAERSRAPSEGESRPR